MDVRNRQIDLGRGVATARGLFEPATSLANVGSLSGDKRGDESELILGVDLALFCGDLQGANVARRFAEGSAVVGREETGAWVHIRMVRRVIFHNLCCIGLSRV